MSCCTSQVAGTIGLTCYVLLVPAAGDALSVLSARLAAMDAGSSQPQRPPRSGRLERTAGASNLANGTSKLVNGTAAHHSDNAATAASAVTAPVPAAEDISAADASGGISPADKVTPEPAKRVPSGSGGGGSAAETASASARAALSGLGAWGRPLGS
jgi:hypothetical protein